jgi:hypothetical protein
MKLKAISLAVAACTLMSGAHALAPTGAAGFDTIGAALTLITAGASAQDKAVIGHVLSDICTSSIDIFTNTAAIPGTNDTSISCNTTEARAHFDANGDATIDNTPTTVLIRKLSGGGSANGILPVANASAPAATYRALNTTNCTSSTPITLLGVANVTPWVCGATAQAAVPTVGFADTEPALFAQGGPNAIGAFNVTDIETNSTFVLTFGPQVTVNLRNALQAAQGLNVGSDALADMPSLSITDLASLYSGKTTNWNSFTSPTGTTLSAGAPVPPLNDRVHVVRRVAGSGTQATLNSLILGNPCSSDKGTIAVDNSPATTTSGTGTFTVLAAGGAATVHEESSAGNVTLALEALNANNQWAIGFNSLEIGSTNVRFVKVNGAEPTLKQVAGNAYPLWAENQITIKAGATGYARAFYDNYKSGVALTELNATFDPRITEVSAAIADGLCGAGEVCVGYLNPANGTALFSNDNPTATANRRGNGNNVAPSMCRPAVIQRPAVVEDGKN